VGRRIRRAFRRVRRAIRRGSRTLTRDVIRGLGGTIGAVRGIRDVVTAPMEQAKIAGSQAGQQQEAIEAEQKASQQELQRIEAENARRKKQSQLQASKATGGFGSIFDLLDF